MPNFDYHDHEYKQAGYNYHDYEYKQAVINYCNSHYCNSQPYYIDYRQKDPNEPSLLSVLIKLGIKLYRYYKVLDKEEKEAEAEAEEEEW